ncbi:hypothetical protein ACSBR1_021316 [Camellia fascicularis]
MTLRQNLLKKNALRLEWSESLAHAPITPLSRSLCFLSDVPELSLCHRSHHSRFRLPLRIIRVYHHLSLSSQTTPELVLWKGLSSCSVVSGILLSFERLSQPIPLPAGLLTRIHSNLRVASSHLIVVTFGGLNFLKP